MNSYVVLGCSKMVLVQGMVLQSLVQGISQRYIKSQVQVACLQVSIPNGFNVFYGEGTSYSLA